MKEFSTYSKEDVIFLLKNKRYNSNMILTYKKDDF